MINEEEVRKAIAQVIMPGRIFEVRVINKDGSSSFVASGYFRDVDTMLEVFKRTNFKKAGTNLYFTIQPVCDACEAMQQFGKFIQKANTTTDDNVTEYRWLFIDLDPERNPRGISASDAELAMAFELAKRIIKYMASLGFSQPIRAISGNGAHLLYRIALQNNDENRQLIKKCLEALSYHFDSDTCKVDRSTFNPSRICKLYGSLAQKGRSTEDRPHRYSRIIGDGSAGEVNKRSVLEALVATMPVMDEAPAVPSSYNQFNASKFSLEVFLDKHSIGYRKEKWGTADKFILQQCPFNPEHNKKDASIIRGANGAIGFRCFHSSCADKTWRDVRLLFEPDAYQRRQQEVDRRIEEGWKRHNRDKVPEGDEARWLTIESIMARNDPDPEYIRTGLDGIDNAIRGLMKGGLSVLSGLRGAAKSTVLSQIMLNAVDQGHRVLCYSGELSPQNFLKWILRQAAGKAHVIKPNNKVDDWVVEDSCKPAIGAWLGDKLKLFNNYYGNDFFARICPWLDDELMTSRADMVVLDNLMALNIGNERDYLETQTEFVRQLKMLAIKHNVHVCYVAHPRKTAGYLRLSDISGSGNLTNMVDTALIIHRNNKDYQTSVGGYYKLEDAYVEKHSEGGFGKEKEVTYTALCDNVIEICKDRESGNVDKLIPLWFEKTAKRFLNTANEHIAYGWESAWSGYKAENEADELGW